MDAAVPVHTTNLVILLLAIATGVTLAARWVRVPYTVALVLVGLALGSFKFINAPHLTKDLVFGVFLPGLVFDAAYHLRFADVRRDGTAIVALAIPGVGVALGCIAALMVIASRTLGLGDAFGWHQALVFGALIAATDPVAVVALFRTLGAPPRLTTLLEAESLLNDGTAIVFLGLVLTAISGAAVSVPALVLQFVHVVGIGAAIGTGVGLTAGAITRRIDDPTVEITLTAIAAYGSFALAEQLGGSGVIATVAAGLVCGNIGMQGMSAATRTAVDSFWEYVAYLLNSIVFLLIGFEVHLGALRDALPFIVVAFIAGLLARILVVGGVAAAVSRARCSIPPAWVTPLTWGGLRGALSMVLALSLPASLPHRELIISTTFGVVILSIVIQGITLSPMLRSAGLVPRAR